MGIRQATFKRDLFTPSPSTNPTPPKSTITSPAPGSAVGPGSTVTISGTAVDSGGGIVGAVEASVDGGNTWHPAVGRENWSYTFTVGNSSTLNVQSRAVDDSGNLEVPNV